jgi:hypothetical protein
VVAVPVGEHDQFTRCVPDAEELVGPECLGHQDAVSLVVPLDPHATTFVAGEPLVNLTHDVVGHPVRTRCRVPGRQSVLRRRVGAVGARDLVR